MEVKPCPFCGNYRIRIIEGIISIDAKRFDKATKICCGTCGAQIIKQSTNEAVEAWNKRTLTLNSTIFTNKPVHFNLNELEKSFSNDNGVQAAIARVIEGVIEKNEIKC
jgi:Lar family restriction alleviation protein